MAGNGGAADEQELQEALRLSMEVNNDSTSGTQPQSAVSAEESVKVLAFCIATAMQQSLSPTVPRNRRARISLERDFHYRPHEKSDVIY